MNSLINLLKLSFQNLFYRKLNSSLTIISLIFGSAAFIATLNSNEGLKEKIQRELEKMGTNLIWINPNNPSNKFSLYDIKVLKKYTHNLESISYVVKAHAVKSRYKAEVTNATIWGFEPSYFKTAILPLQTGRIFDNYEDFHEKMVVVLGHHVSKNLFKIDNPIGKYLYLFIKEKPLVLEVIGVLKEKGGSAGQAIDNGIILPQRFVNKLTPDQAKSSSIVIQIKNKKEIAHTKDSIKSILSPKFSQGITILDAAQAIKQSFAIWNNLNMVGICLALIILITGGLGIMNVMLLSITQRRKEIGLRKAIGANDFQIMMQFLFETTLICFCGGLLGTATGLLFSGKVFQLMGLTSFTISFTPVIYSISFSILIGVLFGLYPAYRASKQDPYEALRD